jgi:DNA repair exonuclease SbcCD ATPase subunit
MVNRADLKTFHKDLSRSVEQALGYKVSIELDESLKGEKQLSALNQDDYKAAKQELERLRIALNDANERSALLEIDIQNLERQRDEAYADATQAQQEASSWREQARSLRSDLDWLTERFRTLLRHVTEIADTMKHRKFLGDWKNALKRLRDNPIAQEALEVGRGFNSERDAKRAEKAIEKGVEKAQTELEDIADKIQEVAPAMSLSDRGRQAREVADAQASDFARSKSYYEHDR